MKVAIVTTAMAGLLCGSFAATTVEMEIDVRGTVRTVVIELNETAAPKTSANFAKLCSQGFYDGVAFHRVIPNYIVQVGDPLSKDPAKKSLWGTGGPGYTVPAEVGKPHLRGSVAMARIPGPTNPDKESSGSQIYFALRDIPDLDGEYTVFGKILSGLEAIEEIADLPKDANFNPIDRIEILSTRARDSDGDRPPTPIPAPAPIAAPAPAPAPARVDVAAAGDLPPMPDLDPASRTRDAERTVPPTAIPPASAVAAVDPGAVTDLAEAEAPVEAPDRGLPPLPMLSGTDDLAPPPAPAAGFETADGANDRPVPAPVEMPPPPVPAPVEMPPAPVEMPPVTEPAPVEMPPALAPAPVEMPPVTEPNRGLPPMPKLFTEEDAGAPAAPTPAPDLGLPPMPKLFTEEDSSPPRAPLPSLLPDSISPSPVLSDSAAPEPVAIPKPVDMPRIDPLEEPSRTASANDDIEEGAITIAEIGDRAPSRSPAPVYRAPESARPAAANTPRRSQPDSAPTAPPVPAPEGNAPDSDSPAYQEAPQEPPKRGIFRGLIRRLW